MTVPTLRRRNLKPAFDDFPWAETYAVDIWAWRRGRTGYPMVDAGMRQLWATGWMHNRARMICASFLVKHLLADWRIGEEWFWDTLVDAEPASNPVNWQWVAGSGADAQPFFRIFNPVLQGKTFDPDGAYVRRWVPELAGLPDRFIHKPWAAPKDVLETAGVRLGDTYPHPIIDHDEARKRALDAFATLKQRDARREARAVGRRQTATGCDPATVAEGRISPGPPPCETNVSLCRRPAIHRSLKHRHPANSLPANAPLNRTRIPWTSNPPSSMPSATRR